MNNNCPICKEPAHQTCRCPRRDSECKNGHRWHTCVKHQVKVGGHSDHSAAGVMFGDAFGCSCGDGKVYSEQLELGV